MERAVLIGVITPEITNDQAYEYLDELAFLAQTSGANPVKSFTQNIHYNDSRKNNSRKCTY